ncbi:hypothetical protein [Aquibium sp. ELW1220]|uniref:hypothetical protein n=1 Tax=Aquibium sp. ELW1220 TaxID=2976766 RepID=UPI0025B1CB07|nr:hypothetical protein [Aquibium sp. ELW1220]
MPRGTVLQWMAARALCEGAPSTVGRVAALMGVDAGAVLARSVAEDWQCIDWSLSQVQALLRQIIAASAAREAQHERAGPVPPGPDAAACDAGADRTDGAVGRIEFAPTDQGPDGPAAVTSAWQAGAAGPDRPPRDAVDAASVLAGASAFVISQMAALIERAECSDTGLDKKEIDGLSAFAGMLERWEARALDRVQEEETTSDEDLARYVRDVNERIVHLAALEARRLLAAGFRPQDDA